ncbi:hypothetical protein LY76DRAFT_669571 [Colletotrichum caudatum]|nr:hypothetical protein LY76DRAFT_669571 [Colletotrichum caudatum]
MDALLANMSSLELLRQRIVSLWGLPENLFARIIIIFIRIIVILLVRIAIPLARIVLSHFPTRTVLALLRWVLATSRIPKLLGIEPDNQDCTSSGVCSICLAQLVWFGIMAIFGLRFAISATRLPNFQRTPKGYAFVYFIGVGCPAPAKVTRAEGDWLPAAYRAAGDVYLGFPTNREEIKTPLLFAGTELSNRARMPMQRTRHDSTPRESAAMALDGLIRALCRLCLGDPTSPKRASLANR